MNLPSGLSLSQRLAFTAGATLLAVMVAVGTGSPGAAIGALGLAAAYALLASVIERVWPGLDQSARRAHGMAVLDGIIVSVFVFATGQPGGPAVAVYPISILAVGILLGPRPAITIAAVSGVGLLVVVGLLTLAQIPPPTPLVDFPAIRDTEFWPDLWMGSALILGGLMGALGYRRVIRQAFDSTELRYRTIFDAVSDPIVVMDPNTGKFLDVNRAALTRSGLTLEQLLKRTLFDFIPADEHAHALERYRQATRDPSIPVDQRLQGAGGRDVYFQMNLAPLTYRGQPALVTVTQDITAHREARTMLEEHGRNLEQNVRERTAELVRVQDSLRSSERLAAVGLLAAGIAHEINNPVGAILLAAQFALESRGDPKITRDALSSIENNARRCGRIVHDVLRFSQAERSDKPAGQINDVIHHAIGLSHDYALKSGVTFSLDLDNALPRMAMNTIEMELAILSLTRNGIEAESSVVTIRSERSATHIHVSIHDDGIGIEPEQHEHLFDPFYTTRHEQGGRGLGLSITQGIVREHGGTLTIESVAGSGTTALLEFPALEDSDLTSPAHDSTP